MALPQYEIHVTVQAPEMFGNYIDTVDRNRFVDVCKYLQIKPLMIQNYVFRNGFPEKIPDLLTSTVVECWRYPTAFRMMQDIALELELANFKVIRRKIECNPKNPRVAAQWNKPGTYFEAHIKMRNLEGALHSCLPISVNDKKFFNPDAFNTEMVTFRRSGVDFEAFKKALDYRLEKLDYDMGPNGCLETEFCLFDDNLAHDADWIGAYQRG